MTGTIFLLCTVIAAGLAIGSISVRGVGLGVAGVLFAGLAASSIGAKADPASLRFARDFGLILFVFSIGTQIGPGFFASLRRSGLKLNLLAAGAVFVGTGLLIGFVRLFGVPGDAGVGLLAGSTVNTPSLAAAQSVLSDAGVRTDLTTAGYALAYPFGVCGTIIAVMLATRLGKPRHDRSAGSARPAEPTPRVKRMNIEVTNANVDNLPIRRLPLIGDGLVVITRQLSGQALSVPAGDSRVHLGDILLVVGSDDRLDEFRVAVGRESPVDIRGSAASIVARHLVVTRREPLGKSIRELAIRTRFGVNISRVQRADVELTPGPNLTLNFGDTVVAVGPEDRIKELSAELGNEASELDYARLVPMFLGIALGVLVGLIPFSVPGLSFPIRIGLAGGPLLVAIAMARVGLIGPLVCYVPRAANFVLSEIGIALFLACVGLASGGAFVQAVSSTSGLAWLGLGALITFVPLLALILVCRFWVPLDRHELLGLLAGCMTNPPALAFANRVMKSDAPSTMYATVYPLTVLLRIVCAQVVVAVVM